MIDDLKVGDVVIVIIENNFKVATIYDLGNDDSDEIRVADNEDMMLCDFSAWVSYESVVKVNKTRREI